MRPFTQEGGIRSVHGFFLPPKKKVIVKKYVTFCFVIPGTIPSKKNMIWAASNILKIVGKLTACKTIAETIECLKSNYRTFIKNSRKYNEWMEATKPLIHEQLVKEMTRYKDKFDIVLPLDFVTIKIYHYWKDNEERDLDNKQSTIYDLLKGCSVILNDNWQCLYKIHSECENYKDQMVQAMTEINVTYMIT